MSPRTKEVMFSICMLVRDTDSGWPGDLLEIGVTLNSVRGRQE